MAILSAYDQKFFQQVDGLCMISLNTKFHPLIERKMVHDKINFKKNCCRLNLNNFG
jgi:hypothetical protein